MEKTKEIEAEYAEFKEFLGSWLKIYLLIPTIFLPISFFVGIFIFIISFILVRI